MQIAGAALVLAGVIVVKLGEPAVPVAAVDTMMVPLEDVQLDIDFELARMAESAEAEELAEAGDLLLAEEWVDASSNQGPAEPLKAEEAAF